MEVDLIGLVLGLLVCGIMFALQKEMPLDQYFDALGIQKLGQSIIERISAVKNGKPRDKVEASPELVDFLKSLQHERLLDSLTDWGARRPQDLKWLSENDLKELGVANDTVFCDAIKCL